MNQQVNSWCVAAALNESACFIRNDKHCLGLPYLDVDLPIEHAAADIIPALPPPQLVL